MKNDKLVSIIVPVYNVERYIEKCLYSIVNQTYKNLEIILVNDGSLENEDRIINDFMSKDSRIRYIRKKTNEGLFKARVTGFKASTGDYIQFIDSDDYINQDFIRLLVDVAEKDNADMVFGKTVTCTLKGSETVYVFQDTELYKLPLENNELKKAYYMQHGSAYIWHTIWNKLYRRDLWEKALPHFEKLDSHLVMTEDIAFSSVLFYYAQKASCAHNAAYFYCKHSDASTNSNAISLGQYRRQISDVCRTFDFLRDFFSDKEIWIRNCMEEFRSYYGRMWYRLAESMDEPDRDEALKLSQNLVPMHEVTVSSLDDNYFCYMEVPYSNELDKIKKRVYEGTEEIISFDVFDTVVVRPFYDPTDIFYFFDKMYEESIDSNTSFYTIRLQGEEGCRETLCNEYKEDVSLQEIYDYIGENYRIPQEQCQKLMKYEQKLEIRFNNRRNIGYELYQLALLAGKKVIFTSDMYLPKETIEKILKKNGYDNYDSVFVSSEYGKLKKTENLFRVVLEKMNVQPTQILHLGDNLNGDIEAAGKAGIKGIHIPKTLDAFRGKTQRITNGHRSTMGKEIAGGYRGSKSFEKNIAYGATIAMAANFYFDNPFVGFNDFTDFNVDSYLAGYYALGTNLIAQITWLDRIVSERKLDRIVFTARDGYLAMEAYKQYLKICHKNVDVEYMRVSRRSMMPWILKNPIDFMNLPIVYQKYSPRAIDELLNFCLKSNDDEWERILEQSGFVADREFFTRGEYQKFMNLFLQYRYDADAHVKAKEIISEYCSDIRNKDGVYDLGYSASIHKAIVDASGQKPMALFVHSDLDKHIKNARQGNFVIESMMESIPCISGLMREFFFSDVEGSCLGYEKKDDKVVPIIENENKHYTDLFPIKMAHAGALKMVEDYYNFFGDFLPYMEVSVEEMLLPFESFLISPTSLDTKMFVASYFEDKVYGKIEKINVRDFWTQLLMGQSGYRQNDIVNYFDELLKKYNKKKLAFFGTGKMCDAMFEENPNMPVEVFLDNNRGKSGMKYRGKEIVHPEDYPNLQELYIVVVIAFYKEVEEQLRDLGLTKYDDYLNYLELF